MISDFSQYCLLSGIIPKLQVGFLFGFSGFSHTNLAKTMKILNTSGNSNGSTRYTRDDRFYCLVNEFLTGFDHF